MRTPSGLKIDSPAWPLLQALISYWGTTDNDGNVAGTTIRCGGLATEPPYDNHALKILSGPSAGQTRDLTLHPAGTDTLTVSAAFTNVAGVPQQITAGIRFVVLSKTPAIAEVAALTALVVALIASVGRTLFSMDFWSAGLEEVQIGDGVAGATVALPDLTVADLPAGATIVRAIVMFKFRMIENTNAAINQLNGATVALTSQVIQIRSDAPTAYVDAINFVDDFFELAATTRESGDVIVGTEDVAATVDEEDTYNLRWLLARADLDFINFNDCQVGLRIWYSV